MAYIGREPTVGNFQVCDAISVVNNQAAYTMQVGGVNVSPETANHMLVSLNGVIQAPGSSYTVSGSTITFASNLVTGDVINFIHILGSVLDLGVPSDNTVTTAKLADSSVSLAKLTATGTKSSSTFLRGDNTFAEAGGGSWIKISTVTASSSSSVDFDNVASTYKMYAVVGTGITPATANILFQMNFGTDGTNYAINKTSLYYTAYNNTGDSDGALEKVQGYSLGNATGNQTLAAGVNANTTHAKGITMFALFGGLAQGGYVSYNVTTNQFGHNNYSQQTVAAGQVMDEADCIRFIFSSGNIAAGTFTLYGIDQ